MRQEKKYRIFVTLPNQKQLVFSVDNFETIEGGLIRFFDEIKGKYKIFDSRLCEIEGGITNDAKIY